MNIILKSAIAAACLAVLTFAGHRLMANTESAPEPSAKEAPWVCECNCARCPPKTVLSKNKGGEYRYRGCFKDDDKNGKCDKGTSDGGKCQNDCASVDAKGEEKKKVSRPPCAGCPCPGNCAHCAEMK